jgi:hypothetical protein
LFLLQINHGDAAGMQQRKSPWGTAKNHACHCFACSFLVRSNRSLYVFASRRVRRARRGEFFFVPLVADDTSGGVFLGQDGRLIENDGF